MEHDDTDGLPDLVGTTYRDSVLKFSHEATLSLGMDPSQPVVALLEVQVLEVACQQVQVGGGRVEVVVDRDAEAVDVRVAVGAWDVPLGGGVLGDAELVLVLAPHIPAPTEDSPHDGEDDQDSEQHTLHDHQLPGGVDVLLPQLLALLQQPMPVEHPERVQVPGCRLRGGRVDDVHAVHDDGACCLV